jgi:translation initiation factor IF-1
MSVTSETKIITSKDEPTGKFTSKSQSAGPKGLVLAKEGQCYGKVVRPMGDRRFKVELVASGDIVDCRLGGSVGYKDRTQRVQTDDWVLVEMRDYESHTRHHERRGEICHKYSLQDARRLSKAGELPERAADQADSYVVFVESESTLDEGSRMRISKQRYNYDMPETPTSDEEQEEQEAVPASAVFLHAREEDLPSPAAAKKSEKISNGGSISHTVVEIDFHHEVGWIPAPIPPTHIRPIWGQTHSLPPPPQAITILARVKHWCPYTKKGWVTPVDKSQTKQGADVELTFECVKEARFKTHLKRNDLVEVTINPMHDRPKVLPGGLKRASKEG